MARHVFLCPLRWSDMDSYGHVNNVVYLRYLEEARVDMLFVHAPTQGASRLAEGVVVAKHEIEYLKPLRFRPEPVRVETWVTHVGHASFNLAYEVCDPGVVYARARSMMVPYDVAESRPRRLLPEERKVLETFFEAA